MLNNVLCCYQSITECWRLEGTPGAYLLQPLFEQGHPEQAAQDHALAASEYLQGGDSTTSLGNLCLVTAQHRSAS